MSEAMTAIQEATPERLTEILWKAGYLEQGSVTRLHMRDNDAFNATTAHLDLLYSDDTPVSAPRRCS
jgi:hypothetical protein